jgi:hypothetical protein
MKIITATIALALLAAGASAQTTGKVRVYVTDNPIDTFSALVKGNGGVASGTKGDDPRTIEIQADLMKSCPTIQVTSDPANTNYVLVLRREGNKRSAMFAMGGLAGLALSSGMKVDNISLFLNNGDLVFATKERTVEKAVQAICSRATPVDNIHPVAAVAAPPAPVAAVVSSAPVAVVPAPVVATPQMAVVDPQTESLGDSARRVTAK